MAFAVHTFETHTDGTNTAFAFHENMGEGQEVYFLAKFPKGTENARFLAESIFGSLIDSLKYDSRGEMGDRFEDALKAANSQAKKNGLNRGVRPDIVVSYFDFQSLYLATSGEAQASLARSGSISRITEDTTGNELFNNLLNGQVAVEDVVVLSNQDVLAAIPATQASEILSRENFDDASAALRQELTNKSDANFLVTVLGIGKKSSSGTPGFLSKVVSKISEKSAPEIKPEITEPVAEILEDEIIEDEEVLAPEEKDLEQTVQEELFAEREEIEEPGIEDDFEEDFMPEEKLAPEEEFEPRKPIEFKLPKLNNIPQKQLKLVAGGVLGILVLVLGVRAITSFESQETSELREQLTIAREALQQADTFLIQGDRVSASELLKQAQEATQNVLNSKSKTYRSDAQFVLADVQEKQLQVENAKKVTPQLLADLATKNDAISANGLLELRGNLFAYDGKQVHKTVRNIVEKGVMVTENSNIMAATPRPDQNVLLFYTDAPQIIEFSAGAVTPMSTEDNAWKNGIDIASYLRFAYVLDPVENQIWKYERKRSSYTAATAYNKGADLSQAVSIAIDGAIYILSEDGTIQKLFRGEKVDFSFRELPSIPFVGQKLKIFTTDEHDYLYVLDPDNARVLVFTKGDRFATYKKQVLFNLPDARDLSVDPAGQKVNIVTKDKIYEFSL